MVRRVLEAVHLTAVGLWAGVAAMAGATAAVMFTQMRELDPSLPGYAAYDGSHADLAAGFIQARVFWIGDLVQFACASLALLTLILMLAVGGLAIRRVSTGVRTAALCCALGALSFSLLVLGPRMTQNVQAYWAAAAAGDNEQAAAFYAAFDADHPTASRTLMATFGLSVIALAAGGFSAAAAGVPGDEPKRAKAEGVELETPKLAGRGARA